MCPRFLMARISDCGSGWKQGINIEPIFITDAMMEHYFHGSSLNSNYKRGKL